MTYLWIKALHVTAVVTWIAGLLLQSLLLGSLTSSPLSRSLQEQRLIAGLRHWDRRITTPAMLIAWILGTAMAMQSHWFGMPWLSVKLAVAGALSALHGVQAGVLRRMTADVAQQSPAVLRFSAGFTLIATTTIVFLVVAKPF